MAEVRQFESGATRDTDTDKHDYEGFFSPLVLAERAAFMHENRFLPDGSAREADNWQLGIPRKELMKSGFRHFMDWWLNHRGYNAREGMKQALCSLIFNAEAYLHDILVKEHNEYLRQADETHASIPETIVLSGHGFGTRPNGEAQNTVKGRPLPGWYY